MDELLKQIKERIYEKLAAIEHERWADWQKYMHSKCVEADGEGMFVCFPATDYRHWERQIETAYAYLSEKEKDSDREQVDRYWPLLEETFKEVIDAITVQMRDI